MVAKVEILLDKYRVKNPVDEWTEDETAVFEENEKDEIAKIATSASFRNRVAYYKKDENGKYALDKNGRRIPVTYGEIFDNSGSDEMAYKIAGTYYKRKIAIKFQAYIEQHDYLETKPELSEWAQYSYEEILQMEANGVLIPEEALEWAHSMQDSEATDFLFDEEMMELLGENSGDAELLQLQKKTLALGNKAEKTEDETKAKQVEFEETAEKAANLKREQEGKINDSLKEIDNLTKEWDTLTKKVKDGKKLSAAEKNRYKELAGLLNGEDGKLTTQIQASNDDLDNLMKMMDGLEVDITENIELGDDAVEAAKELAKYEKTHKVITTETTINPAIDTVNTSITDARGQNISVEAQSKGNSLIDFSNNLDNTLMNAQYTALYEFAQTYTENADEVLNKTQEAMGSDFHKSKEDLEKQIDALPSMNKAEEEQAAMNEKGTNLLKQAAYFGAQSVRYAALSTGAIVETEIAAAVTVIQLAKGEITTKNVEAAVEHINERREYLEAKQEEAEKVRREKEQEIKQHVDQLVEKAKDGDEDAKAELQEMAANKETIAVMVEAVCQMIFSENDKAELETLDETVLEIGKNAQDKLDKDFQVNEKATQKLPEFKELAQDSIDYGVISGQLGAQLLSQYNLLMAISPLFAMAAMSLLVIGMFASISGVASMAAGGIEKGMANETENLNQHTENSLLNDETEVETQTEVAGLSSVAADEEAEEELETGEAETTEQVEDSNDDAEKETGITEDTDPEQANEAAENVVTIAVGDEMPKETGLGEETGAEEDEEAPVEVADKNSEGEEEFSIASYIQNKVDEVKKNEDKKKQEEDAQSINTGSANSQGKEAQGGVKKIAQDVKADRADTKDKTEEAEKDEEKLKKQQKNVEKENEKLGKKIEKLSKDSENANLEKAALSEEYATLSEQNMQINMQVMAAQAKQQQAAANPVQGGLLTSDGGAAAQQQNIATITVNQTRMDEIAARSSQLDTKIAKNTKNIYKTRSKIVKNTQRLKKIAKEKMKIQKEHEKAEKAKLKKMQQRNAVLDIFKNIFTIVGALGTLLMCFPPTAAAGQVLVYIGLAGTLAVAIVQGSIAIAEGDLAGGLMQIGMAVVQAAITIATMGSGAGVMAGISAGINIATSTMDMANNILVLEGKEKNQGLAMASQIIGMVNTLVGQAGGMAQGGFKSAGQWISMIGTTLSMTAQIGTMFAQYGEKDDTTWAQIMGMIGSGLQIAGSIAGLAEGAVAQKSTKSAEATSKSAHDAANSAKSTATVSKDAAAAADKQAAASQKTADELSAQVNNCKDEKQKAELTKRRDEAQAKANKDKQAAKDAHAKADKDQQAADAAQKKADEADKALTKAKEKEAAKKAKKKDQKDRTAIEKAAVATQEIQNQQENKQEITVNSENSDIQSQNIDNKQASSETIQNATEVKEKQETKSDFNKSVRELKGEIKSLKSELGSADSEIAKVTSAMEAEINGLGENPSQSDIDKIKSKYEAEITKVKNDAEYNQKQAELQAKTEIKNQKVDSGMKTAEQIIKITTQAAQIGTQIAGASAADNSIHEQQAKANLDLSSMEKTRALVKKIKRKNKAMAGGHR